MEDETLKKRGKVIRGVCHFYSETGTEGGYWAVQGERFMGIPNKKDFVCSKCGAWMTRAYAKSRGRKGITDYWGRKSCKDGSPHDLKLAYPDGMWSHQGLHILRDGDRLTIYSKENQDQVVWDGIINLRPRKSFDEHVAGWRIHAVQRGINRKKWARWFFREFPAKIVLAEKRTTH